MKGKKIASKLLSILLSAAVIATSSFSGITLVDVNATEATQTSAGVATEKSVDVQADAEFELYVAEEGADAQDGALLLKENVTETSIMDAPEYVLDEDAEKPYAPETVNYEKESEAEEAESEAGRKIQVSENDVPADGMILVSGNYVPADAAAGVVPSDTTVVSSIVSSELAKAFLELYNKANSTSLSMSQFKYSDLVTLDTIDLTLVSNVNAITDASGIGHARGATTINLGATKITAIPANEFLGNETLETIVLPDAVTTIGTSAFQNAKKLAHINVMKNASIVTDMLPSSLVDKGVGSNVFNGCIALTTITIPDFKGSAALQNATAMFRGCTALTNVTISPNVSVIPDYAFAGAGSKTAGLEVTFNTGSKLNNILTGAFQNCNITEMDLSKCSYLAMIGDNCFTPKVDPTISTSTTSTKKLAKLILPAEVKKENGTAGSLVIGNAAFLASDLSAVHVGAYDASKEGVVILPDYVTAVGEAAFYDNLKITSLTISAGLKRIEKFTFSGCTYLTSVAQSTGASGCQIETIGDGAFAFTTNLANADFLKNMTKLHTIGDQTYTIKATSEKSQKYYTWYDYKKGLTKNQMYRSGVFRESGIATAVFPASLRTINSCAFGGLSKLTSVKWMSEAQPADGQIFWIGTDAFNNCTALQTFQYPKTAGANTKFEIGSRSFELCNALKYFNEYGVTNADGTKNDLPRTMSRLGIVAFRACMNLEYMSIYDTVSGTCPVFDEGIFHESRSLKKVSLPSKMKVIPKDMFWNCGLMSFPSFANNATILEEIEEGAFFGNNMSEIDLSSFTYLKYIGQTAFAYLDPYHEDSKNDTVVFADEVYDEVEIAIDVTLAPLKKLVLPNRINGSANMVWDDNMLHGAGQFDTLATPGHDVNGVVYIPSYVYGDEGRIGNSVFMDTAVCRAEWGFVNDPTIDNIWLRVPAGMFAQTNVQNITDCCIPNEYLLSIDAGAYAGTPMKSLDLTQFPALESIGEAAFAVMPQLETVKLPKNGECNEVPKNAFGVGLLKTNIGFVNESVSGLKSVLKNIDFGTVTSIGEYAFATMQPPTNYTTVAMTTYPTMLRELNFEGTSVTSIGKGAFIGQTALETLRLGSVSVIGDAAFYGCSLLDLTDTPLSDSVTKIGQYTFSRCESLGKVTFGKGIITIDRCAFWESSTLTRSGSTVTAMAENTGLTSVDFSKATSLKTIGQYAFQKTALERFDIRDTKVQKLDNYTLSDCPYLEYVYFGPELWLINDNAMSGCIALSSVNFYSATTIKEKAFYQPGPFATTGGIKATPIDKMAITIDAVDLTVGIGNAMVFPYYVNDSTNSNKQFGELIIGAEDTENNTTIHQYVKVSGNIDKYYRNVAHDTNLITDTTYFEKNDAKTYKVNNNTVYGFEIEGLKPTPGGLSGEGIPFSVKCSYNFKSGDSKLPSATQNITVLYKLKVLNIPCYPTLYSDSGRKQVFGDMVYNEVNGTAQGETVLRVGNGSAGTQRIYYNIDTTIDSNWKPKTGNLIVKCSNPGVIKLNKASNIEEIDTNTWKFKVEPTATGTTDLTTLTNGKYLYFTPVSHGDTVVTIYHEDHPQCKVTWNVKVRADIRNIIVSVPAECRNGVQVGQQFNMIERVDFYLNKSVSRKDGTLGNLSKYTDNKIVCVSLAPDVASVTQDGIVTINKLTSSAIVLPVIAFAYRDDKEVVKREQKLSVKYPPTVVGKETPAATGETVKVTKKPSGSTPGEVTYVAPKSGAESVTIPSTLMVNGQKCKVTKVDEGAFAGNKTIKTLTIANGIKEIPKNLCKNCTNLTKVVIPKSVTAIGDGAFSGCKKLKTVSLSSSAKVTSIGKSAFYKCQALTKITIPKKVKTIGDKAFYGCKKLKTVSFHSKAYLTTIGNSSFAVCTSLTKFTIPYKVTTIGSKAFYKDSKLKTITVKSKKVKSVGKNAFKSIYKRATIKVPKSKKSTYKTLFKKGQPKTVKIK